MSDTRRFYDDLADDYDLIYADWEASVRGQGKLIESWLGSDGSGPLRILDVACGMGTQAIGLALCGHQVVGRDLSPALIERARAAAARFGAVLDLEVGDMRELELEEACDAASFDAVIAIDNALPHLETDADLERALGAARAALRPGGRYFATIRDYDRLIEERPAFDPPRALGSGQDRRVVLQVWDWDGDGRGYTLDLLILRRTTAGEWSVRSRTGRYRTLLRAELESVAERAGLVASRWIEPAESGFYQPLFEARRPLR
ncbi:MAG TPA: class I SAM-dependent methyltransferase [Thermoanaerobaculia bacterium]|nr:class I SAM-dependent methyltransferase [Thermoanaerobaculia bacterium]